MKTSVKIWSIFGQVIRRTKVCHFWATLYLGTSISNRRHDILAIFSIQVLRAAAEEGLEETSQMSTRYANRRPVYFTAENFISGVLRSDEN